MAESGEGGANIALVAKLLVVSGILFLVAGAFVLLFVNVVIGLVLLACGLGDLFASFIFSRQARER